MKKLLIILIGFISAFSLNKSFSADMDTYCAVPPFLVSTVSPNILLVLDKSGSMAGRAYNDGEGYFIPNKNYKFVWDGDNNNNGFADLAEGHWEETNDPVNSGCYNQPIKLLADLNKFLIYDQGDEPVYSGHCLNSLFMTRIDLLRWALTGGRPESCSSNNILDEDCDPNIACTGTTCMLKAHTNNPTQTYYAGLKNGNLIGFYKKISLCEKNMNKGKIDTCLGGNGICDCNLGNDEKYHCDSNCNSITFQYDTLVKIPKYRIDEGIIQLMEKEKIKPRFGAIFYQATVYPDKIYIGDYPYNGTFHNADSNEPYTFLKRAINSIDPSGATGTAPALWEAYDYFKQNNDHNYKNGFELSQGTFKDPMYFCDPNAPNSENPNCSLSPCAKNFTILVSDGQWNVGGDPSNNGTTGGSCSIESGYENNSADPVVPAYHMHTDVLRTLTSNSGKDYDIRVSGVYALGMYLGGTGELSLKNVAMYGSFDDSSSNWPGGTTSGLHWNGGGNKYYPWDTCFMDDCSNYYGDGRGSACTNLPPSSSDWDKNGDGIPDTFTNANNAQEIKDSLLAFIKDILKKTSSGTATSILSEKNKKGSIVYQAVFYPQKSFNGKQLSWLGYLYSYWFLNTPKVQNLREDTNENKKLDIENDLILEFKLQNGNLKIYAYDSDATGEKDPSSFITYNSLDDVHPLWESGKLLLNRNPDTRTIYTVSESGNLIGFQTANAGNFSTFLGNSSNFPTCLTTSGDPIENLISYVRGEDISTCRSRAINTGNVWKLGDIIYSTPKVVNYDQYSVVFAGSNDGMLHAFRSGKVKFDSGKYKLCNSKTDCNTDKLGEELWSFIPKNALPYLRYLADPDYPDCHIYIVDGTPYTFDIDNNNDGIPEKRILIGGMRLGGGCSIDTIPPADTCSDPTGDDCIGRSSYFALDITDPTNPQFLWEFSHKDLGFSYSGPAHMTYNGNHYIMFLSGPTTYKGDSSQDLKIFVLTLDSDMKIDDTTEISPSSFAKSFGGRLYTEGIDYNDDGNTDFVFFGVNKNTGNEWQGNVLAVKINDADPENWNIIKIFNSAIKPITAKVEYMKCFNMNYIYFGTGRWFYKTDEEGQDSNDVEHLYGVRIDDCILNSNCNINAAHNSVDACSELLDGQKNVAWKIDLEPKSTQFFKERNIADPTKSNFDLIFFSTTQPNSDICGFGGRSRVWGLNCATGDSITSECKRPGGENYSINIDTVKNFTLFLQLSGGNIEEFNKSTFSSGSKTSAWQQGITPESGATLGVPSILQGDIILWLEK